MNSLYQYYQSDDVKVQNDFFFQLEQELKGLPYTVQNAAGEPEMCLTLDEISVVNIIRYVSKRTFKQVLEYTSQFPANIRFVFIGMPLDYTEYLSLVSLHSVHNIEAHTSRMRYAIWQLVEAAKVEAEMKTQRDAALLIPFPRLFDYMSTNHNLLLTVDELSSIAEVVLQEVQQQIIQHKNQ